MRKDIMTNTASPCVSAVTLNNLRGIIRSVNFWENNWGYLLVVFIGLLTSIAGFLHPTENLGTFFGVVVMSFAVALSCSIRLGATTKTIITGFMGSCFAMYSLGNALASLDFNRVIISLVIVVILYGLGVLGVLKVKRG